MNFKDALKFLDFLATGEPLRGKIIGSNIVTNKFQFHIDTCFSKIDKIYETAIKANDGEWLVVERYKSVHKAKKGHKYWTVYCGTTNPSFYEIETKAFYSFLTED